MIFDIAVISFSEEEKSLNDSIDDISENKKDFDSVVRMKEFKFFNKGKIFKCYDCSYTAINTQKLEQHLLENHNKRDKYENYLKKHRREKYSFRDSFKDSLDSSEKSLDSLNFFKCFILYFYILTNFKTT